MNLPTMAYPLPRGSDLWFDETISVQLGCTICPERELCGGLGVAAPIFDCRSLCACTRGRQCQGVCRSAPRAFVGHVRQIGRFSFANIARVASRPFPYGHRYAPIVYDEFRRTVPLASDVASVPLMHLFNRESGASRFLTPESLRRSFRLAPETVIIASGVADDRAIEAWWRFRDRPRLVAQLRDLGVAFATTPNYSLFTDVTRHDNMHNMKRIALTWAEFVAGGIACALHVNGRTPTDYHRWRDFVGERPEVTAVAFEFTTGARGSRGSYHRDELIALADGVGRPLTLVVRGGSRHLRALAGAFASVWILDATPHMKTKNRQKGLIGDDGRVAWVPSPTPHGASIDGLFAHNVGVARQLQLARLG